jgi:hypothetical protein
MICGYCATATEYSSADDFVISCKFGRSYDSVLLRESMHYDVVPQPSPPSHGPISRRLSPIDVKAKQQVCNYGMNKSDLSNHVLFAVFSMQALLLAEQETPLPREAVVPPPSPGPERAVLGSEPPSASSSSRVEPSLVDMNPMDVKSVGIANEIAAQNEILKAMVSNQQGEMERLRRQLCELQAFALTLASQVQQPAPSKSQEKESSSEIVNEPMTIPAFTPIEVDKHLSSESAHAVSDDDELIFEEKRELYLMEAPSEFKFDVNNPKPSCKPISVFHSRFDFDF